jgi:hypothetical protein
MNDGFSNLLIADILHNSFNFTKQNAGNNPLPVIAVRVGLIEQAHLLTTFLTFMPNVPGLNPTWDISYHEWYSLLCHSQIS